MIYVYKAASKQMKTMCLDETKVELHGMFAK